jgi:hypothetical protein
MRPVANGCAGLFIFSYLKIKLFCCLDMSLLACSYWHKRKEEGRESPSDILVEAETIVIFFYLRNCERGAKGPGEE